MQEYACVYVNSDGRTKTLNKGLAANTISEACAKAERFILNMIKKDKVDVKIMSMYVYEKPQRGRPKKN